MRPSSAKQQQQQLLPAAVTGAKQQHQQAHRLRLRCRGLLSFASLLINILAVGIVIRDALSGRGLLGNMQLQLPIANALGRHSHSSSSMPGQSSSPNPAHQHQDRLTQPAAAAPSETQPAAASAALPGWCPEKGYTVSNWQQQQVAVCNTSVCEGRLALPALKPPRHEQPVRRRWSASEKQLYMQLAFRTGQIGGWLEEEHVHWLEDLSAAQHAMGVFGSVGEIGVQHGKFFLPIAGFAAQQEPAVAVDLFEQQQDNFDASGLGSRELLQQHLQQLGLMPPPSSSEAEGGPAAAWMRHTLAADNPLGTGGNSSGSSSFAAAAAASRGGVLLLTANSMSLTAANFSSLGLPAFRLISVDGGHSLETTLHDLNLASCLLVDGGILVLDDYPNPTWQGVIEAAVHFSLSQSRLQPLLVGRNKAYFVTASHRGAFISHMMGRQGLYGCRPYHASRRVLAGREFCFAGPEGEPGQLLKASDGDAHTRGRQQGDEEPQWQSERVV